MVNGFSLEYEVCNCHKVSIQEVLNVLNNKSAKNLGDIQELTKAGTDCRCCIFEEADTSKLKKKIYCKDILNYYKDING